MRRILIAAAAAVFTVGAVGAAAHADENDTANSDEITIQGPSADELRNVVDGCPTQLSNGEYSEDQDGDSYIPVCQTSNAVHWKADMDIDCDGQRTDECNENTDPYFQPETAWNQSDGQPLISAQLPFIVVPLPSDIWDYETADIGGGTVAAVIYEDKVVYAVVGDLGPETIIGEGSYRLAEDLGIDPDPSTGGIGGAVVDFVLFPGITAEPIEDPEQSTTLGGPAADKLVEDCKDGC
ncbi:MAG: glycoside hydrolase family 75 protein [Stackebrandtia sp.]